MKRETKSKKSMNNNDMKLHNKDNHTNIIKKKNKKKDNVVITVLGCVIVFLVIVLIVLHKTAYYSTKGFVFDYLKFSATNYVKRDDVSNTVTREDNSCHIIYSSRISQTKNLFSLGDFERINDHDWVKQEFENGITWISYYKNSYYIIQMYSDDEETYEKECKKDFDEIKDTFKFIKSE